MINPDDNDLPLFNQTEKNKLPSKLFDNTTQKRSFSKYIVYVDESGDHSMQSIDEQYPVFVLAFCVFHKKHYSKNVVPALELFKFKHFGHDQVVLHEHEIRKEKGAFKIFPTKQHKNDFMGELTTIIEDNNFILISCVIDKKKLKNQQENPENPYHIATRFCLETLHDFLEEKGEQEKLTHIVFEQRGAKENKDLELEFRRVCDGRNNKGIDLPFEIFFSDKQAMSSGLQFADLVARPIGIQTFREGQPNRAFETLKKKFYCAGGRENTGKNYKDWGLKTHPL